MRQALDVLDRDLRMGSSLTDPTASVLALKLRLEPQKHRQKGIKKSDLVKPNTLASIAKETLNY